MTPDEHYRQPNARCAEAIAFAEDAADDLRAWSHGRPKPQADLDPDRLWRLRASRAATIAGLADADPKVRLAALSLFGPEGFASPISAKYDPDVAWVYGMDAAPAVLALALADPAPEVQHAAVGAVDCFYPNGFLPDDAARALGLVALRTGDVLLRHGIYRLLVDRQVALTGGNFWSAYLNTISLKYMTLPLLFDPGQIREIVGLDENDVPGLAPPPTPPVARPWWRRLLPGRWAT